MREQKGDYLHTTIHDFKSNLSKYIRMLERGQYEAVIVKRYNKEVGLFIPFKKTERLKVD